MTQVFPLILTIANAIKFPTSSTHQFKFKVTFIQITIVSIIMISYVLMSLDIVPTFYDPVTGNCAQFCDDLRIAHEAFGYYDKGTST